MPILFVNICEFFQEEPCSTQLSTKENHVNGRDNSESEGAVTANGSTILSKEKAGSFFKLTFINYEFLIVSWALSISFGSKFLIVNRLVCVPNIFQ